MTGIRLAYVSADFREHAVAFQLRPSSSGMTARGSR